MHNLRPQHPSARPAFALARLSLVSLALGLALAAGCGGSKSSDTPAAGSDGASSAPAQATPPAAPESSATAMATPGVPAGDVGARVFAARCALCHGPDGHGDGVASKGLNPKPRNFHDVAYMSTRTDAQLLEVIHNGKGAMPRWQGQLSDDEIKAVLAHVRSLAKKP